jgi:hypothetical protein
VRDGLAQGLRRSKLFIDVDNIEPGQRFDEELAKALATCDVLIAIIGRRWMELFKNKIVSGERDYVREEIAGALKRKVIIVPVRVGREGQLPPLPRDIELPEDVRELVLYQSHDVTYERFRRDVAELTDAIIRATKGPRPIVWGLIGATAILVLAALIYVAANELGWLSRSLVVETPKAVEPPNKVVETESVPCPTPGRRAIPDVGPQNWVFVGAFANGQWSEKNLDFPNNFDPTKFDVTKDAKRRTTGLVNVRYGSFDDKGDKPPEVRALKPGEQVQVKSLYQWCDNPHWWATIERPK